MRACMVAPTKIIAGLGMSLGIDRLEAPGTTGELSGCDSIHSVHEHTSPQLPCSAPCSSLVCLC